MGEAIGDFPCVAYFCMEFALHPELPIYAGGLGVLAGDYLKSAGDLGLPVIGLGILWQKGYTHQFLDAEGRPYDVYPDLINDKVKDTGVRVRVNIRGADVVCRVSRVDAYGNAPLYLLDVNLPENREAWLTDRLYGSHGDDRIAQEIILGVGGVRALRALGLQVQVYHFNEGHAVLAGLELMREKMAAGCTFEEAWERTRDEIVFTTHTPVAAGNESHHHAALAYVGAGHGFTAEQMVRIGGDPFNMTVAGLRLSRVANAVSKLHCETALKMWTNVTEAAPIIPITNGVHLGTWQDRELALANLQGRDLLAPHKEAKRALLALIQARTGQELPMESMLIGFARRAAPYKRGNLILSQPELIEPVLASGRVKLLFAGKAHPADGHGKDIIAHLAAAAKQYPGAVIFLENYDMILGQALTRGCDVWLNTPRRPMEASGTSGMKAALNGVLNLSAEDGWWPEGCCHGLTGWRFGGVYPPGADQDLEDANDLYRVLLEEVLPVYEGNQALWRRMMGASIEMAQSSFSSERMLQEYYRRLYRIRGYSMSRALPA